MAVIKMIATQHVRCFLATLKYDVLFFFPAYFPAGSCPFSRYPLHPIIIFTRTPPNFSPWQIPNPAAASRGNSTRHAGSVDGVKAGRPHAAEGG
jgi:hypothetical protein